MELLKRDEVVWRKRLAEHRDLLVKAAIKCVLTTEQESFKVTKQ